MSGTFAGRFAGRVALVTGGAQGIGRAIAARLAAEGARVRLADVDPAVAEAGKALGAPVHVADLGDRAAAHGVVAEALAAEGRLDLLMMAAGGVRGQVGGPVEAVEEAGWRAIFAANVDAAFWMAQAAAPAMRKAGYGRIVAIASGAGLRPSLTGIQAYTAAKHALVGIVKQLSQDLGPDGITTNAVAPGFVRSNPTTERQWESYGPDGQARLVQATHTRRTGRAEDIAAAACFLASEEAGWITGQILSADGGRS